LGWRQDTWREGGEEKGRKEGGKKIEEEWEMGRRGTTEGGAGVEGRGERPRGMGVIFDDADSDCWIVKLRIIH
jgi:hypothetical protein